MTCSYCFGLCLNEKTFRAELKRLDIPKDQRPDFIANEQSNATVHFFEHSSGKRIAILCMADDKGRTGVEIAGLLVHEAVHIWQAHRDDIGEKQPASEQGAYAIQHIAQALMQSYVEQTTG